MSPKGAVPGTFKGIKSEPANKPGVADLSIGGSFPLDIALKAFILFIARLSNYPYGNN